MAEFKGKLAGGARISKLEGCFENIYELQKMYLSANLRGVGAGSLLISKSLQEAKHFNYIGCYLKTMPNMKAAQTLYRKHGFEYIDAPIGQHGS